MPNVQARRYSSAYNNQNNASSTSSPYVSRAHDPVDLEKQTSQPPRGRPQNRRRRQRQRHRDSWFDSTGSDTDYSPPPPAAVVANSYQQEQQTPMLGASTLRRTRAGMGFRVPNRIMRWLCLALFSTLVLFIVALFRFTLASSVLNVNLPISRPPPKPPVWESFPFLKRYQGGLRNLGPRGSQKAEYPGDGSEELGLQADAETAGQQLQARAEKSTLSFSSLGYNPYPDYSSPAYVSQYGEKRECFLDDDETVRIPGVQHYPGVPQGFPDAAIGSNEVIGIKDDVCFDRFGRLGPYGYGYSVRKGGIGAGLEGHREGAERVWEDNPPVDFRKVDWSVAQNRCIAANDHRFKDLPEPRPNTFLSMPVGVPWMNRPTSPPADVHKQKGKPKTGTDRLPRTAVVVRTWSDFHYTPEDILYLRSLISELSLQSGGEYVVHLLVHVKDVDLPIWSDEETYERVLHDSVPEEFRGLATLWSEKQMALMYPALEETFMRGLPIHGVYRSTYMCIQYFAHQHPEYDYFWNWEMDARNTGHWYHTFDKIANWARQQPRKGLWERNARFYVPSVHGSWQEFIQRVKIQTESGTNSPNNMWSPGDSENGASKNGGRKGDESVWGPVRPQEQDAFEVEGEGIPPTTMEKDKYEWGVGEDADLIVFNPLYDPEGTTWILRDDVTGYNREQGMPPRRTAIITASRLSRKLLQTMHKETSVKRHSMFSEMWPATTALHHGFKAVSVPHSIYIDRRWPTNYLESVFNAGRNGASGGARTAIFGDREHNFRGTSWFYSAGFSPNLWRRWLGLRVDNDGGEQEELAGEGRMCLPPMLLHPIKDVDMIIDDAESSEDRLQDGHLPPDA